MTMTSSKERMQVKVQAERAGSAASVAYK